MKELMGEEDEGESREHGCETFWYVLAIAALLTWFLVVLIRESQVVSRIPAGHVQGVALGGRSPQALIETETGFYPVYGVMRFERGAEVTLQLRQNGEWMLCGPAEQVCLHTSDEAWLQTPPRREQ